eukprot:6191387-Pleurochrysis_carterae.AAC.1
MHRYSTSSDACSSAESSNGANSAESAAADGASAGASHECACTARMLGRLCGSSESRESSSSLSSGE